MLGLAQGLGVDSCSDCSPTPTKVRVTVSPPSQTRTREEGKTKSLMPGHTAMPPTSSGERSTSARRASSRD